MSKLVIALIVFLVIVIITIIVIVVLMSHKPTPPTSQLLPVTPTGQLLPVTPLGRLLPLSPRPLDIEPLCTTSWSPVSCDYLNSCQVQTCRNGSVKRCDTSVAQCSLSNCNLPPLSNQPGFLGITYKNIPSILTRTNPAGTSSPYPLFLTTNDGHFPAWNMAYTLGIIQDVNQNVALSRTANGASPLSLVLANPYDVKQQWIYVCGIIADPSMSWMLAPTIQGGQAVVDLVKFDVSCSLDDEPLCPSRPIWTFIPPD